MIAYWEDIVGSCEWSDIPDIKKAKTAVCCSFGWLIEQNSKTTVIMADFIFEDNGVIKQGGGHTVIPTKNILKIKKAMVKQYGKKKGNAVFYAMENSGKIKGVKKKTTRSK